MYHIFFIHSPVDGHLACFCVLPVVNSAAVNIGVHVSFQILVFSGYMLRNETAESYGNSVFSMEVFFIVAVPMYIPTNSVRSFPFLHTFSSIYFLMIAILTDVR